MTIAGTTTGTTSYSYDVNGNLTQVSDTAVSRVVTYTTDVFGQVLVRQETNIGVAGASRTFFYLNGRTLGDIGTDKLSRDVDYAQQLVNDRDNAIYAGLQNSSTPNTPVVGLNANFDVNYDAYNARRIRRIGGQDQYSLLFRSC